MNCDFNSCELWNGILLGIISSFVFAILTFLFNKYILYKLTYGKIAGTYKGFGYKEGSDTELNDKQISSAIVTHINQNILEIIVDHSNSDEKFIWNGELRLNTKKHGRITYKYSEPARMRNQIGIKDCIISDDNKTLFLIDVDKSNYGREVFKR
jgi:hypothetical protein